MSPFEALFDIAVPMQDVQARWERAQKRHAGNVGFSVIDESHTRVHVRPQGRSPGEIDRVMTEVMSDLRAAGLVGPEAAGNPAFALGVAPGAAGGGFAGSSGGTPGPGGGVPGPYK